VGQDSDERDSGIRLYLGEMGWEMRGEKKKGANERRKKNKRERKEGG